MNSKISQYYARYLNPSLSKLFEEYLRADDEFSLSEELSLMRVLAKDAIAQYSKCDEIKDEAKREEAKLLASINMTATLKSVAKMCKDFAFVKNLGKDNSGNIAGIVSAITRIVYEMFGDDLNKVRRFEELVREQILLHSGNNANALQGTDRLPSADRDVLLMDSLVPKYESNGHNGKH